MKRWVLLVPLSVCLAACGPSASGGSASTPSPTPAAHQLGEAVTVPGWQVTIKSFQLTLQHGSVMPAHPDDMVLLLEVTVQNTTVQKTTASESPFQCRGADGTAYDRIATGASSIDGRVEAGRAVSGQVAFEVPIGTHRFNVFYEGPSGTLLATWRLSVSPTQ